MQFFWLRDRENQGQFQLYWDRGTSNLANYFMKHYLAADHKKMRLIYLALYTFCYKQGYINMSPTVLHVQIK